MDKDEKSSADEKTNKIIFTDTPAGERPEQRSSRSVKRPDINPARNRRTKRTGRVSRRGSGR